MGMVVGAIVFGGFGVRGRWEYWVGGGYGGMVGDGGVMFSGIFVEDLVVLVYIVYYLF